MAIVILQLPDVKRTSQTRPKQCPYCQAETFQRWVKVGKPVRDNSVRRVQVYRYRCCHCRRTLRQVQGRLFRNYPSGVDRADQTLQLRKLAALMWVLGLSMWGAGQLDNF